MVLVVAVGGITTLSLTLNAIYFVELSMHPLSFMIRGERVLVWYVTIGYAVE